jgi:dihydrodipicolinate synthase/N-acetylneuraminate lyase
MFSGAMTAMVTPFREGRVDEARLREQVDFQIKGGIDALVPVGTTGESPTLNFEEHLKVIELTIKFAAGRVPVIGGTGANATTEALELHSAAKKMGASASLSVNPYYNKPSQEGLYRHFMTLADRVDLPIVLYNIPGRTGITMSATTVARLAKHPNIVAIKEATGSLDMASEIMSLDVDRCPRRDQRRIESDPIEGEGSGAKRAHGQLHRCRGGASRNLPADQDFVPGWKSRRNQIRDETCRLGRRGHAAAIVGSQRRNKNCD